jgi:hypothetical protein
MTKIKPSVGRKIYYYPKGNESIPGIGNAFNKGDQPFDATIVYVHSDDRVNLFVSDHDGNVFTKRHVEIVAAGMSVPSETGYAQWMEYQVNQQAKHDLQKDHGMSQAAAEKKVASGQLGDDRTATEGEPQRGDPADPDPRTPPTTEHISGDVSTRVEKGLPAEKTETEKKDEETAHGKADKGSKTAKVDPSLQRKK